MDDEEEQPVEEVEPKIILSAENIQEGLSQLYRTPGKSPFNTASGFLIQTSLQFLIF
jgi:hypothetical protein